MGIGGNFFGPAPLFKIKAPNKDRKKKKFQVYSQKKRRAPYYYEKKPHHEKFWGFFPIFLRL